MHANYQYLEKIFSFLKKNHFVLNFFISFFAGLFFALGFAPFNNVFFCFSGLFFLYLTLITNTGYKNLFLNSLVFISSYVFFSLRWIYFAPLNFENFKFLAPFAFIFMILYLEFYFLIFTSLLSFFLAKLKKIFNEFIFLFRPFFFSGFFIFFFEFLRSKGSFGFPWNLFGTVFLDFSFSTKLIQKFGIFWFGFLMLLIFCIIFEILFACFQRKYQAFFFNFISLFLFLFFLVLITFESKKNQCLGDGFSSIVSKDLIVKKPYIGIRMISTFVNQKNKWQKSFLNQNLIENAKLSFRDDSSDITYFVWPETSFSFIVHLDEFGDLIENQNIEYLASFLKEGQFLIFGAILKQKTHFSEKSMIFNSIIVIDHKGKVISFYKKKKLAPFGEFLPLSDFLDFLNLKSLKIFNSIEKGPDDQPCIQCFENNKFLRKFYPLICFEAIFPLNEVQTKLAKNSDFILNVSNDAWFDFEFATSQHLRMVRVRAIEASKPLMRIANGGFSALIDKNGKILKISSLEKASYIDLYLK
jgi:apolipoprotein N-acyltransferase